MKQLQVVLYAFLAFVFALPAYAQDKSNSLSEYGFSVRDPKKNNKTQSKASGSQSSRASGTKKRVTKLPEKKGSLVEQAATELVIQPADQSPQVVVTAATVRSQVQAVMNPIRRPSFLVGLSVQPYEPRGRAQLQGVEPADLGHPGVRAMPALELRWLPVRLEQIPGTTFGLFGSLGYVQHQIAIEAPTGVIIQDARLNTYKTQLGLSGTWHRSDLAKWGIRGELGGGQLAAVQSSSSSYANASNSLNFLSAGAYLDWEVIDRVTLSAGYDHRIPSGTETANLRIPRQNFMLGVSGGFQ